jgi:FtsZ-binding cell division protein ZapB
MCTDINFRAIDLLNLLQPKIEELEKEKIIEAKVHSKISNLREFLETFAY